MKMGIFRASSWAHSQGTFRVRALGSKPRFWSTAKELQGTILYQYHGTTVTAVVPVLSEAQIPSTILISDMRNVPYHICTRGEEYQVIEFVHLICTGTVTDFRYRTSIISDDKVCASDMNHIR